MNGKRTPKEVIEAVIDAVSKGSTVYGACKAVEISDTNYDACMKFYGLEEEHKAALEAQSRARINWAWECLRAAAVARDEQNNPTPQGVKSAMAILYSKRELTDTRQLNIEHSGSLNVTGLADVFAEAAKKLAEGKPDA